MKILIGTPIHEVKDYAMERWLENVAKVQKVYPADLLLVDNSSGVDYVNKVKSYCTKCGVKNFKIKHIDHNQDMNMDIVEERIEKSQIIIGQEMLSGNYDAWLSWECDIIIPTNTLKKLTKLMKIGNFMAVVHNFWVRENPKLVNCDMGLTLMSNMCIEKYGYELKFVTRADYLEIPDKIRLGDYSWFIHRVYLAGGNYAIAVGLVGPIYHLEG